MQESEEIYTGKVIFYNKKRKFGFISLDSPAGCDVFFHDDDIISKGNKKKIKQHLLNCFLGMKVTVSFNLMNYLGKYKDSLKAINITFF